MGRLFTSGIEFQSDTADIEFSNINGNPDIETTIKRTGTASVRINSSGGEWVRYTFASSSTDGPIHCGCAFYIGSGGTPTAETTIFDMTRVQIKLNTDRTLGLYENYSTKVGSSSAALNEEEWNYIEMRFDKTGGGGANIAEARLNGSVFATDSALTIFGQVDTLDTGHNMDGEGSTTDLYFDDIYINDGNGSFETGYAGQIKVIHLKPNAVGDNTDWSRGGTDSGSNYGQVDEQTPNDATDYVVSNTLNEIDDYNLEASGLTANDTISTVSTVFRFRVSGAGGSDPDVVTRIKASALGTVEESSAIDVSSITWGTNTVASADPMTPPLTLYDLPGASTTAWTASDLDSAQAGLRISTGDASSVWVSTLHLQVSYLEGEADAFIPKVMVY